MKKLFLILAFLPLFISGQTLNLNNNQVKLGGDTSVVIDGNLKADTIFGVTELPYKVYIALLNQTGTNAPTATVLQNTLGFDITYGYETAGVYYIYFEDTIYSDKTVFIIGASTGCSRSIHNAYYSTPTMSYLESFDFFVNDYTNGCFFNTAIEIRVYP